MGLSCQRIKAPGLALCPPPGAAGLLAAPAEVGGDLGMQPRRHCERTERDLDD